MQDRYGRPYGWGVAEYATPEELFGYDLITSAYQRDPQESKAVSYTHLDVYKRQVSCGIRMTSPIRRLHSSAMTYILF